MNKVGIGSFGNEIEITTLDKEKESKPSAVMKRM